jgi:glycosyltransferase involved in cell wall biosynthesis
MRILIATPIYPPEAGGPATYTVELARRLSADHEITIVAYADEGLAPSGCKLIAISKQLPLASRLTAFFKVILQEAKRADIIYVQNAVAAGFPAAVAGMLSHKPVVLKMVGDEAWERATQAGKTKLPLDEFHSRGFKGPKTLMLIEMQKWVLSHVTKVVPPSQFLRDIIVEYYNIPADKVEVNYNAFESSPSSGGPTPRRAHQLLSVGRLVAWKGVDGIIRAFAMIREKFPDANLVVAGDGPEEKHLHKIAAASGVNDGITFTGRLGRAEIDALERQSGLLILNSTYEGLPHIALESFAAQTPIIATNIPGTREAVIDNDSGLLVSPQNDQELAGAIGLLLTDASLREKLVAGGERLLKEKFSWEAHIKTLLAVFWSLAKN